MNKLSCPHWTVLADHAVVFEEKADPKQRPPKSQRVLSLLRLCRKKGAQKQTDFPVISWDFSGSIYGGAVLQREQEHDLHSLR